MRRIRIAIVGVGNCASSLVQGIQYYRAKQAERRHRPDALGHRRLPPGDIEVVAAFDIDVRKVGKDVSEAIFAPPNCTTVFCERPAQERRDRADGRVLDGSPSTCSTTPSSDTFVVADAREADQARRRVGACDAAGAEILVNYLPGRLREGRAVLRRVRLEAGVALRQLHPGLHRAAIRPGRSGSRERASPSSATTSRPSSAPPSPTACSTDLFRKRGRQARAHLPAQHRRQHRLPQHAQPQPPHVKEDSKTEAVQSVAGDAARPTTTSTSAPATTCAWQNDNKVCFLRMEGKLFGDVPMNLELRLSVEDSPNSAGVAIDAIRCCKLALDAGHRRRALLAVGLLHEAPARQYTDDEAYRGGRLHRGQQRWFVAEARLRLARASACGW